MRIYLIRQRDVYNVTYVFLHITLHKWMLHKSFNRLKKKYYRDKSCKNGFHHRNASENPDIYPCLLSSHGSALPELCAEVEGSDIRFFLAWLTKSDSSTVWWPGAAQRKSGGAGVVLSRLAMETVMFDYGTWRNLSAD